MAQDTALLRYLLKGARRAPGSGSQRDLAFAFDGTNDYISSNATIGRTGYDMNVAGNVSTGSDGDGSYFWINGNRDHTASTGTVADIKIATVMTRTQTQDFTIKVKCKILGTAPNNNSGLFGSGASGANGFTTAIWSNGGLTNTYFSIRGSSTVTYAGPSFVIGTTYDLYLVYSSVDQKMYCYRGVSGGSSTLLNSGGTAAPTTFTFSGLGLGDSFVSSGNSSSCNKYIYHAAIRNKALTQAEIDADIALGNTTKNDPTIVAYYIPDNLQYNTQYIANPKDLTNASRAKFFSCTATANTTVAPDGTTTADTVTFIANHNSQTYETNASVTGSALASKTFIIKVFVKVASGTKDFRLKLSHVGVTDYQSGNLSATTTWQEFTFTQTFTSSTAGTGIKIGVMNASTAVAGDIQVRNVRVFLVNETLRDESPNIGGFIGWKTPKVLSCRVKPGKDGVSTGDSQCLFSSPRLYTQIRDVANNVVLRYENTLSARSKFYTLGAGFRDKVHVTGVYYWDTPNLKRELKLYINGVSTGAISGIPEKQPPNAIINTGIRNARKGSTYFSGNIRDARIYTFTGSFTDADAIAIYNGGEPTSSGVTKYLHYKPPVGEVGTTTQDQSPNDRDGTLNNGVTRNYI